MPPHEVLFAGFQGGGEGEHRGQRKPVVEAGLEVERMAERVPVPARRSPPARRAPGRSGSAGRRAAATRSSPVPPAGARAATTTIAVTGMPDREVAQRQLPVALAAARPRPRVRRGTGSRSARPSARSSTKPEFAFEALTDARFAEHEAGEHVHAPPARGSCAAPARTPARRAPAARRARRPPSGRRSPRVAFHGARRPTACARGVWAAGRRPCSREPNRRGAPAACSTIGAPRLDRLARSRRR